MIEECFDTAIIGAGIAGLSAAYAQSKDKSSTVIIEPGQIGGLVQSQLLNGFLLELGPNVIVLKPELKKLISELELDDEIEYPKFPNYQQMIWHNGKAEVVPKSLKAFICSKLFSLREKLFIIKNFFNSRILHDQPEDLSVAELMKRVIGARAVKNVLEPALLGIYGGNIERLSARSLFPGLWTALSEGKTILAYLKTRSASGKPQICKLRAGIDSLVKSLVAELEKRTVFRQDAVSAVAYDNSCFKITMQSGKYVLADRLIAATPAIATANFIKSLNENAAHHLGQVQTASIVVAHLSIVATDLPQEYARSFGILIPSYANSPILGIMFNSVLFPSCAPEDRHLLTVCLGGVGNPGIIEKDEQDIAAMVVDELTNRFKIKGATALKVTKWVSAIPQYNLGHHRTIEAVELLQKEYQGLYFTGSYVHGVGVPDRIAAAFRV